MSKIMEATDNSSCALVSNKSFCFEFLEDNDSNKVLVRQIAEKIFVALIFARGLCCVHHAF